MFGETGFGFGEGAFGATDASRQMLYRGLPYLHRSLDAEGGGALDKMFRAFEQELEVIRGRVARLVEQRDPYKVWAGESPRLHRIVSLQTHVSGGVEVVTDIAHGYHLGELVHICGVSTGTPLLVGQREILEITGAGSFRVAGSLTAAGSDGYVMSIGERASALEIQSWSRYTGTEYGSVPQVEFVLKAGQDMSMLGVGYEAVLEVPYPSPPVENLWRAPQRVSYKVLRIRRRPNGDRLLCEGRALPDSLEGLPSPLVLKFVRPSLIEALSQDFGVLFDSNDTAQFRRSGVANVVKYLERKGSEKGYQIRGETAGFDVAARGLFETEGEVSALPSSRRYVDDTGVVRHYTELEPRHFRFDEMCADVEGVDIEGNVFGLMDEYLYEDNSADGRSRGLYYADEMFEVEVLSSRVATESELASLSLTYGQVLEVSMDSTEWERIGVLHRGSFRVRRAGVEYFIEGVVSDFAPSLGMYIGEVLVGYPSEVLLETGAYTFGFCGLLEEVDIGCRFAKSATIAVRMNPTDEYSADESFSGSAVNAAIDRLRYRMEQELKPVHARFGVITLEEQVEVLVPEFLVEVSSIETETFVDISLVEQYDIASADSVSTDENVLEVSVSITIT